MSEFTRAEIERQRDVAIDMVVCLIETLETTSKSRGALPPTAAEMQAALQKLTEVTLPLLDVARPEAVYVLEAVTDRLLSRGSIN
jgi:hypothetical protein